MKQINFYISRSPGQNRDKNPIKKAFCSRVVIYGVI